MPVEGGAEIGTPVSVRGREFVFVRNPYKWVSIQKGSSQYGKIWHLLVLNIA